MADDGQPSRWETLRGKSSWPRRRGGKIRNALNSRARNDAARGFKGDREEVEKGRGRWEGNEELPQLNPGVLSAHFLSRYAVTAAREPHVYARGGTRLCKLFSDRSREFNSASRASSVPKRMVISVGALFSSPPGECVFETSGFYFFFLLLLLLF